MEECARWYGINTLLYNESFVWRTHADPNVVEKNTFQSQNVRDCYYYCSMWQLHNDSFKKQLDVSEVVVLIHVFVLLQTEQQFIPTEVTLTWQRKLQKKNRKKVIGQN